MAYITHILGFLLLILWFGISLIDENLFKINPSPFFAPYLDQLSQYKWYILGSGVFLIILSFLKKSKLRNSLKRNDERWHRNTSNIEYPNQVSDRYIDRNDDKSTDNNVFPSAFDETYTNQDNQLEQQKDTLSETRNTSFDNVNKNDLSALREKVSWSPLAGGGANFKTSYLYQSNQSRIEVLKSNGAKVFSLVFILMGGLIPGFITYELVFDEGFGLEALGLMAFGLIFVGVGILMLFYPKPRVFDMQVGWFWTGSKNLTDEQEFLTLEKSARLNDIAAIQIVAERLSGKNSSYTSWEINLVSHDAKRLNVMDHGNHKSIKADAQMLSNFLNVPVWEKAQYTGGK